MYPSIEYALAQENQNLQNTLQLNLSEHSESSLLDNGVDKTIDSIVREFAENFLLKWK